MIDAIIEYSIRNKLIVLFFVAVLIGWGGWSASQLPIDALPDITNNQVIVYTQTPALAAQEVEQFITTPLERSFANLPQVTEIRSVSRIGISVITIVFEDDADEYRSRQLVSEQIQKAQDELNTDFGKPIMAPISTGLGEIYQYEIRSKPGFENSYSLTDLRSIQDWIVKRQLTGIKGVIEVSSFGGKIKQYEVAIDPNRLRATNIKLSEVFEALQNNNASSGGSYIEKNSQALFIRGEGMVKQLSDIEQIVIKTTNGIPVLIRQVADVRFGNATRYGAMTANGKGETAGGIVMMLKGENSAATIKGVKARIIQIQKTLPQGLEIHPFLDRTRLVDRAIGTVTKNLLEGGLVVVFVLVLLLGSLRAGLVVASVIPLSMLFTLAMMRQFGLSANLMSLGAIDFGLIVDGAVIIVESIMHHLHKNFQKNKVAISQNQMDDAVLETSIKIRKSAAFGEIVIMIVYLPIMSLTGIEGKMFGPMAITVAFALFGALILSLTYVPMVSALFLSKKSQTTWPLSDKIINGAFGWYQPSFVWAMAHKKIVVGASLVLLLISGLVFMRLGGEFIPELDEGDFAVDTRMPTGASLGSEIDLTLKAERALLKFPEVKEIVAKIGSGEVPTDPMPLEAADMMVILNENRAEWKNGHTMDELADTMQKAIQEAIPGAYFDFQQPIQMRFNELMTGVKSDIAVKIYGEDLDILYQKGLACAKIIQKIDGVSACQVEAIEGVPQLGIVYKRDKMAQYGVNTAQLNQLLKTAFAGQATGVVYEGERRYDLVVRLDSTYRQNLDNLKALAVSLPNGGSIPLQELAQISQQEAAVQISRDDTKRRITIGINVRNRDIESLVAEVSQKIEKKVALPTGYYFKYGGAFENLEAAKARLSIAVPVALLLIFMLLYFTFNSLQEAILIFTAVPFSAIGGIFALWLTGIPFSISAGVGFIALFGVAVLNGIVLIGSFNQLESEGLANIEARIEEGVAVRFRPVIMTALVASLGFLPMALSNSAGSEVQKPLAIVVIGGLVSATVLTLIVLPVLYALLKNRNKTTL